MNELLLIGILVSLIFTELTDLSPGGIIVPAYFAMYIYEWKRMGSTALLALACILVVRLLSHVMILYGRRRFALYVIVGILFKFLFGYSQIVDLAASIGYLVPGLLGRDMERQGCAKTLLSLAAVTLMIRILYLAVMR